MRMRRRRFADSATVVPGAEKRFVSTACAGAMATRTGIVPTVLGGPTWNTKPNVKPTFRRMWQDRFWDLPRATRRTHETRTRTRTSRLIFEHRVPGPMAGDAATT